MTDPARTYATPGQRCRATALLDARQALEARGQSKGPLTPGGTKAPLVEELLTLAQWIVAGELDDQATSWWIRRPEEQPAPTTPPLAWRYGDRDDVMPCATEESR